ncbi:MAG: alpha/beta hydrolase [Rhizobiaceae bacterium]|nr:alpha/beta hydrolase [Rhizobiaceae bacterium]
MTAELFEIEGNPIPENAVSGRLTMRDGVSVRYARFAATGRPLKGTVIIVTGRNEYIEKYFETIRDLSARGLGTLIFDLRGQGLSDRLISDPARGYVADFDDYAGDVEELFERVALPDCRGPFFLLGHSIGATIGLLVAPAMVNRIRRMVLLGPLLGYPQLPVSTATLRRVTGALHVLGLGRIYASRTRDRRAVTPFAVNKLTTDHTRYERNLTLRRLHPELALAGPTASWVYASCRAIEKIEDPDFLARINVPTLIMAAGADEVVSTPAIERLVMRLRAGSLITIDGARHEMLQESDLYREQVLAAFDAFVPGSGEV